IVGVLESGFERGPAEPGDQAVVDLRDAGAGIVGQQVSLVDRSGAGGETVGRRIVHRNEGRDIVALALGGVAGRLIAALRRRLVRRRPADGLEARRPHVVMAGHAADEDAEAVLERVAGYHVVVIAPGARVLVLGALRAERDVLSG